MDSVKNTSEKTTKRYVHLSEELINEVKKREIIWNKNHAHRTHRRKLAKEWEAIGATLNKSPRELKSKWRNIKDTFHREAKKVEILTNAIDKPIINYYTGQWAYFEDLMFLWDPDRHLGRNNQEEVYIQIKTQNNITVTGDYKEEIYDSESEDRNIANDIEYPDDSFEDDNIGNATFKNVLGTDPIANDNEGKRKRLLLKDADQTVETKKRCELNCGVIEDNEIDEDLHFAKSLVPFMRKLNPIRKLIVRNEMHSLLLKELLCERCKSIGPQPNCRCNL